MMLSRAPKRLFLLSCSSLVFILFGCSAITENIGRNSTLKDREAQLLKVRSEAERAIPGSCYKLTQEYQKDFEKSPRDFSKRIDLEYIRQGCIRLLTLKIGDAEASSEYELMGQYAEELLKIDPLNQIAQGVGRDSSSNGKDAVDDKRLVSRSIDRITPTSQSARVRNTSDLNDLNEFDSKGIEFQAIRKKLYVPVLMVPDASTQINNVGQLFQIMRKKLGIPFVSTPQILNLDISANWKSIVKATPIETMGELSDLYGVNFAIFADEIVVFDGEDIPADISSKKFLASLKIEYASFGAVIPVIKSALGDGYIIGGDDASKIIWLLTDKAGFLKANYLVNKLDVPPGEVIFDVEIYEVTSSILNNIGLRLPTNVRFGVGSSGSVILGGSEPNNGYTLSDILTRVKTQTVRMLISDPAVQLSMNSRSSLIKILSKPTLRVQDGNKSRIFVGDKTPTFSASSTSTGFISESVSYQDSGLKLEITAKIKPNNTILSELSIDSTQVTGTSNSPNGTSAPSLGTRTVNVQLSLMNGETVILGGLINTNNQSSKSGLPGIGLTELAPLGGDSSSTSSTTELLVMVTAHIKKPRLENSRAVVIQNPVGAPMQFPWGGLRMDQNMMMGNQFPVMGGGMGGVPMNPMSPVSPSSPPSGGGGRGGSGMMPAGGGATNSPRI